VSDIGVFARQIREEGATLVVENADFGRKTRVEGGLRGAISDTWFLRLFAKSFSQRELAQKWGFSKMSVFLHFW
jgi:hypothetical protein